MGVNLASGQVGWLGEVIFCSKNPVGGETPDEDEYDRSQSSHNKLQFQIVLT